MIRSTNSAGAIIRGLLVPIGIALLLAPRLMAQQSAAPVLTALHAPTDIPGPVTPQMRERLVLGPGDLLTVTVFNVPELLQTIRVSEKGDAVLSLIGTMHLGGMTVADAQVALENEYRNRKMLVNPQINILVTEYATQGVSVLGEVTKPGVYPLLGPHTLLDIISAAGGLTEFAGSTVSVRRRGGDEQVVQLNVNDPQKSLAQDVELQPADMVVVSRAAIAYVVGDVGKPGGFPMQNNGKLTVLQAIALASGVNKTAAYSKAKIIRKTPSGYQEIDIHLSNLMQGKSRDVELDPEDIVFVPNSKVKSAVAGGYTAAVQAATTAVIYAFKP